MSIFSSLNIATSGLTAQKTRMDIISQNIANVDTTQTDTGLPYQRKEAVLSTGDTSGDSFYQYLSKASQDTEPTGVTVESVVDDTDPFQEVYDPTNPEANADGYVLKPNVDLTEEMVDLMSATRSYEANATALDMTKSMMVRALDLGN